MNKQLESKIDEFVAHGGIGLGNTGGFEIQINDAGDKIRIRYPGKECSSWIEIQDGCEEDNASFIDTFSENEYYFHEIMKY